MTVSVLHVLVSMFSRSFYYTFRLFKDSLKEVFLKVLADRVAARSMIGCWHDTAVCLSVCDAVHCGTQGRCRGL